MTEPTKCEACGQDYYDKICKGCNIKFRTHEVRRHFHSTQCQQFDYRIKKHGKYTKKGLERQPAKLTESQSKAVERMKLKAEGQ